MRALYDPFLHGSERHFGSVVWVSFELGQLDRYPYHHSHFIIDLPRFGILGMSGSSSSLIATLVSHLVSLLSSTSLFIFFYPHQLSSCFMNDVSFDVHHLLLGIVHLCVGRVALLTLFSYILHCTHRGLTLSIGYLGLCFSSFHSPFTPSLHYDLSRKTTLRP